MRSLALLATFVGFVSLAFFCGLTVALGMACVASLAAAAAHTVMPSFAKG